MSPYSTTLSDARLEALHTLLAAMREADTPAEKRRCAVAILRAPTEPGAQASVASRPESTPQPTPLPRPAPPARPTSRAIPIASTTAASPAQRPPRHHSPKHQTFHHAAPLNPTSPIPKLPLSPELESQLRTLIAGDNDTALNTILNAPPELLGAITLPNLRAVAARVPP